MRGRRPPGPEFVQRLTGQGAEKERLEVILQTITGALGVKQAAARLGISTQRLHALRQQCLQAALDALAPQPVGRPRHMPVPAEETIDALERDKQRLRFDLDASRARERVAVLLSGQRDRGEKKTGAAARRRGHAKR
jgi:hypothetical protein